MTDFDNEERFEEDEVPYISDDDEYERDGTVVGFNNNEENLARREEIGRSLEEILENVYEWSDLSEDEDAQQLYEDLANLVERVNAPFEDDDV